MSVSEVRADVFLSPFIFISVKDIISQWSYFNGVIVAVSMPLFRTVAWFCSLSVRPKSPGTLWKDFIKAIAVNSLVFFCGAFAGTWDWVTAVSFVVGFVCWTIFQETSIAKPAPGGLAKWPKVKILAAGVQVFSVLLIAGYHIYIASLLLIVQEYILWTLCPFLLVFVTYLVVWYQQHWWEGHKRERGENGAEVPKVLTEECFYRPAHFRIHPWHYAVVLAIFSRFDDDISRISAGMFLAIYAYNVSAFGFEGIISEQAQYQSRVTRKEPKNWETAMETWRRTLCRGRKKLYFREVSKPPGEATQDPMLPHMVTTAVPVATVPATVQAPEEGTMSTTVAVPIATVPMIGRGLVPTSSSFPPPRTPMKIPHTQDRRDVDISTSLHASAAPDFASGRKTEPLLPVVLDGQRHSSAAAGIGHKPLPPVIPDTSQTLEFPHVKRQTPGRRSPHTLLGPVRRPDLSGLVHHSSGLRRPTTLNTPPTHAQTTMHLSRASRPPSATPSGRNPPPVPPKSRLSGHLLPSIAGRAAEPARARLHQMQESPCTSETPAPLTGSVQFQSLPGKSSGARDEPVDEIAPRPPATPPEP